MYFAKYGVPWVTLRIRAQRTHPAVEDVEGYRVQRNAQTQLMNFWALLNLLRCWQTFVLAVKGKCRKLHQLSTIFWTYLILCGSPKFSMER